MSHNIVFDEERHKYYLNGFAIPCVSEILDDNGFGFDRSKLSQDVIDMIEYKALVGTEVHKGTELIDEGTLDLDTVPSEIKGYLDGYQSFLNEYKPKVIESEKIVYCDDYIGTLDRVIETKDKTYVVDIKTSTPKKFHRIQLSAYQCAYGEKKSRPEKAGLYLSADGNFCFKEYPKDSDDYKILRNCIENFYFKHPKYRSKKQPEGLVNVNDWL